MALKLPTRSPPDSESLPSVWRVHTARAIRRTVSCAARSVLRVLPCLGKRTTHPRNTPAPCRQWQPWAGRVLRGRLTPHPRSRHLTVPMRVPSPPGHTSTDVQWNVDLKSTILTDRCTYARNPHLNQDLEHSIAPEASLVLLQYPKPTTLQRQPWFWFLSPHLALPVPRTSHQPSITQPPPSGLVPSLDETSGTFVHAAMSIFSYIPNHVHVL